MVTGSAQTISIADIKLRDNLIADQANLLNAYRCLFDVDTELVAGGCEDNAPVGPKVEPAGFEAQPTHEDLALRDELICEQENL
ncbi:MAG: hypothetical protein OXF21_00190, partial [bacterium]|nr:hypothetical protein [bacterium]